MIDRKQEQRLKIYKRNIYCRWTVEKYILLSYLDLLVSFVHLNTKEKTSFSDKNYVNRKMNPRKITEIWPSAKINPCKN